MVQAYLKNKLKINCKIIKSYSLDFELYKFVARRIVLYFFEYIVKNKNYSYEKQSMTNFNVLKCTGWIVYLTLC